MENPFQKIITDQKLPVALKEKVLNDVAAIKLILDIADLTFVKYPSSLEDLYKTANRKKK
jgi:hypothetical protein